MRTPRHTSNAASALLSRSIGLALLWGGLTAQPAGAADAPPAATAPIASVDLSPMVGSLSAWRFTATQGPPIEDTFGSSGDTVPGAITLCLRKGGAGPCDPRLQGGLDNTSDNPLFSERHYLDKAQIVRTPGPSGRALLLVTAASLHSGDGDQLVQTQVLAYQPASDRFVLAYEHSTGRNNNQEVRYIEAGRLAGDIIAIEPAETAPFGFWVSVNAPTPSGGYRQTLRYRSATLYADGNPLAVIDSEMANIQRRLGLWRPGLRLPLPAGACPKPHLVRMELWCG